MRSVREVCVRAETVLESNGSGTPTTESIVLLLQDIFSKFAESVFGTLFNARVIVSQAEAKF